MLKLLLNPSSVSAALCLLAFATPVMAYLLKSLQRLSGRRGAVVCLAGPAALALWLIHLAVIEFVGFDRVASAAIVIGIAGAAGLAGGFWLGSEGAPRSPDQAAVSGEELD